MLNDRDSDAEWVIGCNVSHNEEDRFVVYNRNAPIQREYMALLEAQRLNEDTRAQGPQQGINVMTGSLRQLVQAQRDYDDYLGVKAGRTYHVDGTRVPRSRNAQHGVSKGP